MVITPLLSWIYTIPAFRVRIRAIDGNLYPPDQEKDALSISVNCPFCSLDPGRIISETKLTFTIRDGFPISPRHTLIIPKRHVASFFEVTNTERNELLLALESAKKYLDREHKPNGYNIGINEGASAGQTVPHLHIHLIPRYKGDCEDPRGGIRWIFPKKAKYWSD